MGFIVEIEFPTEELVVCKIQGNVDSNSLLTLFDNIIQLHKDGAMYFILEGKKLKSFSRQAFKEFARVTDKYFQKCTFVFCNIDKELQNEMDENVNKFSFFNNEKGCLDFFAQHLGISISSENEQTDEKCGAATIAMTIPDNLKKLVQEEEKKNKK